MGVMMARGLQLKEGVNGTTVSIASQMGTSDSYEHTASDGTVNMIECDDLLFALFPVVHWKHAVRVRCRDLILRLPAFPQSLSDFAHTRRKCDFGGVEPHLRLVPVHTYYDWTKREGFDAPVLEEHLASTRTCPRSSTVRASCSWCASATPTTTGSASLWPGASLARSSTA